MAKMKLIKKPYVYTLVDPRIDQPFYVGKGQGDRVHRHVWCIASESKKKRTNPIRNKRIREILAEGLEPTYTLKYFAKEAQAYKHEKKLIKSYGRLVDGTGILTNMSPGGEAPPVTNRKQVYQFTEEGTLIATHLSAEHAAKALNVSSGSIRLACSPKHRQGTRIKGFLWSFEPTPPKLFNKKERPVLQLNGNEVIQRFASAAIAGRSLNLDRSQILLVCKGRALTGGGYRWIYEEDYSNR